MKVQGSGTMRGNQPAKKMEHEMEVGVRGFIGLKEGVKLDYYSKEAELFTTCPCSGNLF